MDILLTHGYFISEDEKEQSIMKPYAPLGLLYLSSHLRKKGFDVEIYDSTFGSRDELSEILREGPPSVIGIYSTFMTRESVLRIIADARSNNWTVVLGGPEPSVYAEQYLNAGAHLIVEGESEITMDEVLTAFRNTNSVSLRQIPGLIFLESDFSVVRTPARELLMDLDSQPWPDREHIEIEKYVQAWRGRHGIGSLSLITARGCPFHCRWCSHSVYGNTHRRRSVKGVVDEVEWLVDRYHPDMLWIADDVFTIKSAWILQYAREMKERGLQVPFECITRADRVDAQVADSLAELGCFRVWIGCESGSQRILDAMERGVTLEQVRNALRLFHERAIETGMFVMWGYEGENIADIEATIDHIKTTRPDVFLTAVCYPIKGTRYYDEVAARLVCCREWHKSTDRDLVIMGRNPGEFYACADRLLKNEVALQKMIHHGQSESKTAADLRTKIDLLRRTLHATFIEKGNSTPGI